MREAVGDARFGHALEVLNAALDEMGCGDPRGKPFSGIAVEEDRTCEGVIDGAVGVHVVPTQLGSVGVDVGSGH